jgi:hypothetical protein
VLLQGLVLQFGEQAFQVIVLDRLQGLLLVTGACEGGGVSLEGGGQGEELGVLLEALLGCLGGEAWGLGMGGLGKLILLED